MVYDTSLDFYILDIDKYSVCVFLPQLTMLVMYVVMMDIKVLWMECLQICHVTLLEDIVTQMIHL